LNYKYVQAVIKSLTSDHSPLWVIM